MTNPDQFLHIARLGKEVELVVPATMTLFTSADGTRRSAKLSTDDLRMLYNSLIDHMRAHGTEAFGIDTSPTQTRSGRLLQLDDQPILQPVAPIMSARTWRRPLHISGKPTVYVGDRVEITHIPDDDATGFGVERGRHYQVIRVNDNNNRNIQRVTIAECVVSLWEDGDLNCLQFRVVPRPDEIISEPEQHTMVGAWVAVDRAPVVGDFVRITHAPGVSHGIGVGSVYQLIRVRTYSDGGWSANVAGWTCNLWHDGDMDCVQCEVVERSDWLPVEAPVTRSQDSDMVEINVNIEPTTPGIDRVSQAVGRAVRDHMERNRNLPFPIIGRVSGGAIERTVAPRASRDPDDTLRSVATRVVIEPLTELGPLLGARGPSILASSIDEVPTDVVHVTSDGMHPQLSGGDWRGPLTTTRAQTIDPSWMRQQFLNGMEELLSRTILGTDVRTPSELREAMRRAIVNMRADIRNPPRQNKMGKRADDDIDFVHGRDSWTVIVYRNLRGEIRSLGTFNGKKNSTMSLLKLMEAKVLYTVRVRAKKPAIDPTTGKVIRVAQRHLHGRHLSV